MTDKVGTERRRISSDLVWPIIIGLSFGITSVVWVCTAWIWMGLVDLLLRFVCKVPGNSWAIALEPALSFLVVYILIFLLFCKVARKHHYL